MFGDRLLELAKEVVQKLQQQNHKIVFAESCTAGLLSAVLSQIPGVSDYLCGSAVTYRNDTKASWLNVSRDDLNNPSIGAVSSQVAGQMCTGVLNATPEATVSVSVTGHLGPNAPVQQDGLIYIGVCLKNHSPSTSFIRLQSKSADPAKLRHLRQVEAAQSVLEQLLNTI